MENNFYKWLIAGRVHPRRAIAVTHAVNSYPAKRGWDSSFFVSAEFESGEFTNTALMAPFLYSPNSSAQKIDYLSGSILEDLGLLGYPDIYSSSPTALGLCFSSADLWKPGTRKLIAALLWAGGTYARIEDKFKIQIFYEEGM